MVGSRTLPTIHAVTAGETAPISIMSITPNQPKNDTIDVWRVHEPGRPGGCIFNNEADAILMKQEEWANGFTVEIAKEKMPREEFETLGEFEGF